MKLGFIGLGRMGKNMVLHLAEKGHRVVVYNRHAEAYPDVEKLGALPSNSLKELVNKLETPRVIWIMITSGNPVDEIIRKLTPLLVAGDTIIDGGNSYYEDSKRRAVVLAKKGIHFLDCGTSGGIEGARHGASLMIGGNHEIFKRNELLFKELSNKESYAYVGESGAGHFIKMIHNGIEYGMIGALAEGFEAIHTHQPELKINVHEAARVYAQGSIIEGKLMNLLQTGLKRGDFEGIDGSVPKGETEQEMHLLEKRDSMKILKQARLMRVHSRKNPTYSGKITTMLRNEFGGHSVQK